MASLEKTIIKQINEITSDLIESSFSIKENYVSENRGTINWSGFKDIAFTLKKQPYEVIYNQCILEKAYNLVLLDNAIIQFMYRIDKDQIVSHRLAYLPHPNYINLQDSPDTFEELSYGNEYFTDIIEKKVISIPIRFDFDISAEKYVEHHHTYSHMTLGNFKNCRIPLNKPVTPKTFILFILRNFYFDRFNEYFTIEDYACDLSLEETITKSESNYFHVHV